MNRRIPKFITIPFILVLISFCFYVFSGGRTQVLYEPIVWGFLFFCLLLLLILGVIGDIIDWERLKFLDKEKRDLILRQRKVNYFSYLYKSAIDDPKEKGEEVEEIDHDFDGIIELDNKLPTWWVSLFYLTILFAFVYFLAYLFTDFAHPEKEYDLAYDRQMKEVMLYELKQPQVNIDEAKFSEELIEEGKALFIENCATCHGKEGGGDVGPNLTDPYWINKPEPTLFRNIFYMIYNGSKKNPTMRGFGLSGELKGNDIQKISSYIYSINKSDKKPPNAKAPEGDLVEWEEE